MRSFKDYSVIITDLRSVSALASHNACHNLRTEHEGLLGFASMICVHDGAPQSSGIAFNTNGRSWLTSKILLTCDCLERAQPCGWWRLSLQGVWKV